MKIVNAFKTTAIAAVLFVTVAATAGTHDPTTGSSNETRRHSTIVRVDMNLVFSPLNTSKAVIITGAGIGLEHGNTGAGIVMLDLITGVRLWHAGRSGADLNIAEITHSFPSPIRAIDLNGDDFVDRLYAIDVVGQLFRFDIFSDSAPKSSVTGGVIARFGENGIAATGTLSTRRFYSSPDVSIFTDPTLNRSVMAVGVGSGNRAHPLDTSASDAYYSLRDPDVFTRLDQGAYKTYDIALDSDMHEVNGQINIEIGLRDRGWKFALPTNQAVLSGSTTFDDSVFFLGFSPNIACTADCQIKTGENFLYRLHVASGDPVVENPDDISARASDAARVTALHQGGIAPRPSFMFPSDDNDCTGAACSTPPIGCVGVECFDAGFANNPVRTLWTQSGIE